MLMKKLQKAVLRGLCLQQAEEQVGHAQHAGALVVAAAEGEETVPWQAVSGLLCYRWPENKRVSRYNIRLSLAQGAAMEVYVQYDSDGVWRSAGGISAAKSMTDACLFPVRPHRCDHLQLKLEGLGEVRIFSLARILEVGSDYR